MKKILIVFGTRPEAIKMSPVVKAFQSDTNNFETKVCVTAQHREMLDQVLDIFEIKPDYDLNLMKQGQDLHDISARVLVEMRPVLQEFKPDVVFSAWRHHHIEHDRFGGFLSTSICWACRGRLTYT